jgi:hypothetical protein
MSESGELFVGRRYLFSMLRIRAFVNPENRFGSGWLISYGSVRVRNTADTYSVLRFQNRISLLSYFETLVEFCIIDIL